MRALFAFCWAFALTFAQCPGGAALVHADAPLGRYTVSTDIVLDARTHLAWQRAVPPGTYTQAQALSYCASISLSGTGWRLPSVMELQSLVDDTRVSPAIDVAAFPGTPSEWFWTSSGDVRASDTAWFVHFGHGNANSNGTDHTYRVRCVR